MPLVLADSLASPTAAIISNTAAASGSGVDVTGAGSDWEVTGLLAVGELGTGSLAIDTGGRVATTYGAVIAETPSADGSSVSVSGSN